jgi:hypothetical protein
MQAYKPESNSAPAPRQPKNPAEDSLFAYRTPEGEKRWGWLLLVLWLLAVWPVFLYGVWRRTGWRTSSKWICTGLVVIAALLLPTAIVVASIPSVNSTAACNALKADGATIQAEADLYYNNNGAYPDATGGDKATPAAGDVVDITKLKTAHILNTLPPASEAFTYHASPNGEVHGALVPNNPACAFH